MSDQSDNAARQELLFLQLASMFQVAAMQQMGKLMDPTAGEVKRDMDQAKMSIDILDMLKTKTEGNRSENEEEFLNKILFELHMNYVDEMKNTEKETTEESSATSTGDQDAANESTPDKPSASSETESEDTSKDSS